MFFLSPGLEQVTHWDPKLFSGGVLDTLRLLVHGSGLGFLAEKTCISFPKKGEKEVRKFDSFGGSKNIDIGQ